MARRKHNAAVKRKLIAKGNNNVKMDRNADLKSYAGKEIRARIQYFVCCFQTEKIYCRFTTQ